MGSADCQGLEMGGVGGGGIKECMRNTMGQSDERGRGRVGMGWYGGKMVENS